MEKMHTKRFFIGFFLVSIITIATSCSILSWIEMRITTVDVKDMVIGNKENGIKF